MAQEDEEEVSFYYEIVYFYLRLYIVYSFIRKINDPES